MKLDVNAMRYLSSDDLLVLKAVELGMRKHEIVPSKDIVSNASLKHEGTYKVLKNLLKHKLLHCEYDDEYRLTYLGYDFLAIHSMVKHGVFCSVGRQIGVGKESDIFEVANEDGTIMAMKLYRLGRVSFRAVKSKRDYTGHRSSCNWLYLSKLAAFKEFKFMKALEKHDFPVPKAIRRNRHCVIMSLVQGYPLAQVKQLQNPDVVFETIIGLVVRLAEHKLIHCDFNEFNIMIDDDEKITMIDFPQMECVSHRNAQMYFDREIECIFKFFRRRFKLTFELESDKTDSQDMEADVNGRPSFSSISVVAGSSDKELAGSGFTKKDQENSERFNEGDSEDSGSGNEELTDNDLSSDDESAICEQKIDVLDRDIAKFDSLDLTEQESSEQEGDALDSRQISSTASSREEVQDASDKKDNSEEESENHVELVKRGIGKGRKKAIASARGRRHSNTSRNHYKDKGGKSSNKARIRGKCNVW